MKQLRKTVDNHLPKWLGSKFLSAIDYIWQVKDKGKKKQLKELMMFGIVDNSQMKKCRG